MSITRVRNLAKVFDGKMVNIEEKPVKIDKWDGSALKNALDDEAKKVLLDGMEYHESTHLLDGRLLISTLSVGFALFALLWDWLHPFPESRPVLILCVVSYFILMGVLTLYTTYMEKGIFLVAQQIDVTGVDPTHTWSLSSTLKKYDDKYTLRMQFTDGRTKNSRDAEITKSVANFFDEDGYLCSDLFDHEVKLMHKSLSTEKKSK